MIHLYTYRTSNGRKVSVMLEECGLTYKPHVVDITAGEQHAPDFLAISPNGRIPAIVDAEGPEGRPLSMFESGAILLYLADKTGQFIPKNSDGCWASIEWLMWQIGGVGPNFGQAFHFLHQLDEAAAPRDIAYCGERYGDEVRRLCAVMDQHLSGNVYLAGGDYSIADIANFPWIALHRWFQIDLDEMPNLRRWYDDIRERPAVRRGMDIPTREEIAV
ncbi:MAG: glutathione binding-like protein [Pseudomonadota bacterium]|nr:glutathione binding-like protein [Pseudomonadota bacterium]